MNLTTLLDLGKDRMAEDAHAHAMHIPATAVLTLVSSLAGLRNMQQAWRNLETSCARPISVFQSYDWVAAWCETYGKHENDLEIHLLAGYDQGELVFVWPLMKARRAGLTVLTWLTDPFGQYGDVLCAKGQRSELWAYNCIRFLKRLKNIDLLRLRHVPAQGHAGSSFKHLLIDAKLEERAPYLDLTQFSTEADYEARYTPVQRKRRKKIRKSLEAMGELSFNVLPIGTMTDQAMKSAITEKNLWLKERGRINRVMGCPEHLEFLKRLSRNTCGSVQVVVSEIKAGNQPVSWEIGFRHGNSHFAYITSHVNDLTDLSPGRIHMDHSQKACLADGMDRFDLMVPYDAHKESWSSACATTNDYFLPLSGLGWVVGHGYLRTIRPILRKFYYRLSPIWARYTKLRRLLGAG